MRIANSMLQRGTRVITDNGVVGRLERYVNPEVLELLLDRPAGWRALVYARDVRLITS